MFAPYKESEHRWVKLHGNRARARFFAGETIYFCPCKTAPGGPWNLEVAIDGREWLRQAESYRRNKALWKGSVEETAWQLALNNWRAYAEPETGTSPHY